MRILVMGIDEIDESKFHPCNDSGTVMNKPPVGTCLYGSTMFKPDSSHVCSEWTEFTQFDYTDKYFTNGISFKLKRNVKIIEIDDVEDYRKVLQQYPYEYRAGCYAKTQIDFYKMSLDYDAFHLTSRANEKMRLPCPGEMPEADLDLFYKDNVDSFYTYDAETWILFNIDCIDQGSILNHNNIACTGGYE